MRYTKSHEHKVAEKISELVADLRLDIVLVGEYLADIAPRVSINRIILMAEVAKEDMENAQHHDY